MKKDKIMKFVGMTVLFILVVGFESFGGTKPGAQVKQNDRFFEPSKSSVGWAKRVAQGFNMQVWISNQMCLGLQAWDVGSGAEVPVPPNYGLEYPVGSGIEHLFGAGPWIGGIVNGARRVSEGYNGDSAEKFFLPNQNRPLRELIWHTSTTERDPNEPNRRGCDDDGDGRVDEDDLDGMDNDGDWVLALDDVGADGIPDSLEIGCKGPYSSTNLDPAFDNFEPSKVDECHPDALGNFRRKNDVDLYTEKNRLQDHGEPHVDEDYAAISERDYYTSATDTIATGGHFPLGVKVIQKSYAWSGSFAEGVLPFDYYFVNVGRNIIKDVYVAFFADMDVGPTNVSGYFQNDFACYEESLRTAYIHNPIDRGSTPLGITVLNTPRPVDSLDYVFQWYDFTTLQGPGTVDSNLYSWMSGEAFPTQPIATCQSPTGTSDTRFFFSFGPLGTPENPLDQESTRLFKPGDTLKISIALVGGEGVDKGPNNLKANAEKAIKLFKRGFIAPTVPPSPALKITEGFRKITLEWGRSVGDSLRAIGRWFAQDPTELWDDSNKIAQGFPPDSWRRLNPPCDLTGGSGGCGTGHRCVDGYLPGGRVFEGYRLYRSEDPNDPPSAKSFTLLKQFDIPDDDYGYNVGLDTVFVDSNLVRGKRYWYSVTSFGIPDVSIVEVPVEGGGVRFDSLFTESPESDLVENRKRVDLTFSASEKVGEVLVVPNPYRVDNDYTYENGGWEGLGRSWSEQNRLIRFIHLPRKCVIRVFTIAGDLVTTLNYEAPESNPDAGQLDWNLLSESNRALASGMYVFSVESELGTQIGKFVLIR